MTWADELTSFAGSQVTDREREALYARGVSDEQIELFQIGYLRHANANYIPGLVGADEFLRWARGIKLNDVFVYPMTNMLGDIKGFQFRSVDREKRGTYTDFFLAQDEPVLFGLGQAMPYIWDTESVFLVEGVYDLFPLHRHYPAIVATMTAKVTDNFLRLLRRMVRRLWLGYDMDKQGRKVSYEFAREHGREFENFQVVSYPKVYKVGSKEWIKDPGDLWETWGDARVKEFIQTVVT